jgi:hypothetical protein
MMNPRLLFPLLCLLLAACSSSEVLTSPQGLRIKSVSIEETTSSDKENSETSEICKDARLSEADVRDFFEKSWAILSFEEIELIMDRGPEGKFSACDTSGTIELEGVEHEINWGINHGGIGMLYFESPLRDAAFFYCDTCDIKRRYPIARGDLGKLQPHAKTITILYPRDEQYLTLAERCQEAFTLTPDEVRNFFKEPRRVERSGCYLVGKAELEDGTEAIWRMYRFRNGVLVFDGETTEFHYDRKEASGQENES